MEQSSAAMAFTSSSFGSAGRVGSADPARLTELEQSIEPAVPRPSFLSDDTLINASGLDSFDVFLDLIV